MAQGNYIYDAFRGVGKTFADLINERTQQKLQEEAFNDLQKIPTQVTQYPTTDDGTYAFGGEHTKVQNPDYMTHIMSYLAKTGVPPQLVAQVGLQQYNQNKPTYQEISPGSTLAKIQGDKVTNMLTTPSKTSTGTFWKPTGKREQMANRAGEWYDEFDRSTSSPTGGREWRGYGTEASPIQQMFGFARAEDALSRQFTSHPNVKDFLDVASKNDFAQEAYKVAQTKKDDESFVAADQAIITLFNKITDPQSVVRESEYARTPSDMSLVNSVKAFISRQYSGGRLEPQTRADIMKIIKLGTKAYAKKYATIRGDFQQRAKSRGLDPFNVTGSDLSPQYLFDEQPQDQNIKTISSDEEYDALPSGTVFIDPEGVKRTKP